MQEFLNDIQVKYYENGGIHVSLHFENFGVGLMFKNGEKLSDVINGLQSMASIAEHEFQTRSALQRNGAELGTPPAHLHKWVERDGMLWCKCGEHQL